MIVNLVNIKNVFITGSAVFAIAILFFGFVGLSEYENQKNIGDSFLRKLDFSINTNNPLQGVGEGQVYVTVYRSSLIPLLDSTEEPHEIDVDITYMAYAHDKTKSYKIDTDSYKRKTPKFDSDATNIDTSKLLENVGNSANVCASVKVTYAEINLFGILGKPSKDLGERCTTFSGTFS